MVKTTPGSNGSIFGLLKSALGTAAQTGRATLEKPIDLTNAKVRVALDGSPMRILLGENETNLCLSPETPLAGPTKDRIPNYILFESDRYFSSVSGFIRLTAGDKLVIGREDDTQIALFDYSKRVARRHLSLTHEGDTILFRKLASDAPARIERLDFEEGSNRLSADRLRKLGKIREIFGGPVELLSSAEALELIEQVNEILESEAYRPRDFRKLPGGLVKLPDKLQPVIIGDLHTQVDNLLNIITRSGVLEELESGKACLVFLGDAVHSETDGEMEFMESSMLIMDLIFRLKVRFPDQLFYIRGNHDSFSDEIAKEGIPQGLLWSQALRSERGKAYKKAMDRFYELVPYMACSKDFIACHAAAPKAKLTEDMLIDVNKYPGLIKELTTNRMQRPNRPAGYGKGDIKRLRKTLGVDVNTPFVVGHTPLSRDDTLWENAGGIENHYILYSAAPHWVGLLVRQNKRIIPLRYPAEKILPVINGTH